MIYFWGKKIKTIKCNYVIILQTVTNVSRDSKMASCLYVLTMERLFKHTNTLEFYLTRRFHFFPHLTVAYIDLIYK